MLFFWTVGRVPSAWGWRLPWRKRASSMKTELRISLEARVNCCSRPTRFTRRCRCCFTMENHCVSRASSLATLMRPGLHHHYSHLALMVGLKPSSGLTSLTKRLVFLYFLWSAILDFDVAFPTPTTHRTLFFLNELILFFIITFWCFMSFLFCTLWVEEHKYLCLLSIVTVHPHIIWWTNLMALYII